MKFFFDAGADLICLSEAEETIIDIAKVLEKGYRTLDIMEKDQQLVSTSKMGELLIFELDLLVGNKWQENMILQ